MIGEVKTRYGCHGPGQETRYRASGILQVIVRRRRNVPEAIYR